MNELVNKAIGCGLKQLRIHSGLTQQQLACRLRVTQSFISRLEAGERNLHVCDIFPYALALEVTPEKLYLAIRESLLQSDGTAGALRLLMAGDMASLNGFWQIRQDHGEEPSGNG